MAEHYRFFDSIDGGDERYYTADEFAEYFRQLITSGIFNGGENLRVTTTGVDMSILIGEGYAWLEGYLYKIETEPLVLTLDAADPNLDRIDRVVIRLDKRLENRYVKAFILKGEPAEEPIAPGLTRDENIYEISLAQIKVIAGKSFIGEEEIIDERFDEAVCGIVNSLIKVDTSHLIKAFEDEWQTWYKGIKDETFVPIGDFRDGFIRTPEDLIYSTPDSKLQFEKGWPINRNTPKMELEGLGLNKDGSLYINTLKDEYVSVYNSNVLGDLQSQKIYYDTPIAVPFGVDTDVKHLQITINVKRNNVGNVDCIVCGSNNNGLPNMSNVIGEYTGSYNDITTSLSEFTWEVSLNELLRTNKQYFLIIDGYRYSNKDPSINVGYSNTPGETNFYFSSDRGSTWTPYERTIYLNISGKELVDEGVVTIDYSNLANFKKHGLINLKIIDNVDSYYLADVLDLNGNIVKGNITPGKYLFEDNLSKDTKVRIRLIKVGEEEAKLRGFEHLWVADISKVSLEQVMVPSENIILSYPNQTSVSTSSSQSNGVTALYAELDKAGRYRLKCEFRSSTSSTSYIYVFLISATNGMRIGYASVSNTDSNTWVPITIDLNTVPANSLILLNLRTSSSTSQTLNARNIEICGEPGYIEPRIYVE